MTDLGDLFGRSLGFDLRIGPSGSFEWSEGPDNIRESILLILMTEPGERLMRPTFGAGLERFLHEPNVASTHRLIEERIVDALRRWERRIELGRVEIEAHPSDPSHAVVTIHYQLVATGDPGQVRLSVPVAKGA